LKFSSFAEEKRTESEQQGAVEETELGRWRGFQKDFGEKD